MVLMRVKEMVNFYTNTSMLVNALSDAHGHPFGTLDAMNILVV